MSVVFAQGMRRSGTTILFDLLWGDPRLTCFYEPLNAERAGRGGGSKARDVDYQAASIAFRARFLAARGDPTLTQESMNWGAPRAPELELIAGWPDHVRDFVAAMAGSAPRVFVKFTRASHHVGELARIRPDAWFVHVVRDPRSVASSHLLGTRPEQREAIVADGSFFTRRTGFDQWRAESMARRLVADRPELAAHAPDPAFVRVMLLWRELYLATRDGARAAFPGRTLVVWHDALCRDPASALRPLLRLWDLQPSAAVLRWAAENVRPAKPWHDPANPAWSAAIDRLGLAPLVAEAESDAAAGTIGPR